jgi:hypothetical protein
MDELQIALGQLDGGLSTGERENAITTAIAVGESSLSGGWERVGEIEAAQLAQWLGSTEDLRVTSPGVPALAPAITPAPEA